MIKGVLTCLILVFIGCSQSPVPTGILAPEKMEKVVYDMCKVDEYLNSFAVKDTTADIKMRRSLFYAKVFKLHDTNRKEFYRSYTYYQQHPDIQKALFDSILAKATRVNAMPAQTVPKKSEHEN